MHTYSPFWSQLAVAKITPTRIVFTDIDDPRILQAVEILKNQKVVEPVFAGPASSGDRLRFSELLAEKQKRFNLAPEILEKQLDDPLYQGLAMLLDNRVDGLVGGSTRPTADIVRAAIQCVGPRSGYKLISGQFFIETEQRATTDLTPFLFADCAVVPEPSARILAATAIGAAASYKFFTGLEPRVAMLSFSTRGSAEHPLVDRIREAVQIVRKQDPSLTVDGEIQVDAALDRDVAVIKNAKDSLVAGKPNVFVFPTLEAGNIGYKLVQKFSRARVAGPLLWGLAKPMSDLSRGCTTQEIVDTAHCVSAMAGRLN